MNIKWIFFDVGSTLVDETKAYDHRIWDMIENTDITFSSFDAKRIELAKKGFDGNSEAIKYYGLNKTPWHSEDEIPFEIPDSWVWCKLGELTKTITKGSSPKWQGVSYTDKEYGILFITSENVGVEQLLLSKEKYVGSEFNTMHPASVLQKGDLLTNIVGASIGRTAIFDLDVTGANINQAVCIIRLVNQDVSEYILKFLNSTMAVEMMSQKSVDSARANLSLTSVTNLLIPLPPLAEQKRIVAKLEEILPLCERLSSPMISTLTKTISSNDNKSNITRVEQLPKKEYIVRQAARSFGETSPNDTADLIKYYIERKNNDKKT